MESRLYTSLFGMGLEVIFTHTYISSLGIQAIAPINYSSNYLLTRQILSIPTQKQELKLKPSHSSSITEESPSNSNERNQGKKKLGVVVKPMGKSRLVFRFIWMEKNIGIAIDQVNLGGRGTIPELKATPESKHWISYKQMVTLLNIASEIINLWQHNDGN
ncbi:hypothetical protein ACS0TY_005445 [Phlomoides rotata]